MMHCMLYTARHDESIVFISNPITDAMFLCIVLTAKSSVFPPGTRRRIRNKLTGCNHWADQHSYLVIQISLQASYLIYRQYIELSWFPISLQLSSYAIHQLSYPAILPKVYTDMP